MNTQEIEKLTTELIAKYNPQNLSPFPFNRLMEDLSDVIVVSDELLPELAGAAMYREDVDKIGIIINDAKSERRQYYAIAHEFGHYFLHKHLMQNGEDTNVFIDTEKHLETLALFESVDNPDIEIEAQANSFAMNLLMPRDLVTKAWESLKSVEKCADIFNVTVVAMSIRLEMLELINI